MDPAAEPQSAEVAPPLGEAPDVDGKTSYKLFFVKPVSVIGLT